MDEIPTSIFGSGSYDRIEDLLDNFHMAAATANLLVYFGCFHPEGRFLGTDSVENWHVSDFYNFSKPYFDRGSAWVFRPIHNTRKISYFPSEENPVFAIFDELLESESFLATSRGSGTLVYNSGKWLIAQYHLSFPIPNDLAKDMTKKIATFESAIKDQAADIAAQQLIEEWEKESNDQKSKGNKNNKSKKGGK
jgi:hypothetical protein